MKRLFGLMFVPVVLFVSSAVFGLETVRYNMVYSDGVSCLAMKDQYNFEGNIVYKSNDCRDFYPLYGVKVYDIVMRSDGRVVQYKFRFEDTFNGGFGELHYDYEQDKVIMDGKLFQPLYMPKRIVQFHHLPNVRETRCFFKTSGGQYIYVSSDRYGSRYATMRVFLGSGKKMNYIQGLSVSYNEETGGFRVETTEGTLSVPPPEQAEKQPATWQDKPVEPVDPTGFKIQESGTEVRASR